MAPVAAIGWLIGFVVGEALLARDRPLSRPGAEPRESSEAHSAVSGFPASSLRVFVRLIIVRVLVLIPVSFCYVFGSCYLLVS